MQDVELSSAHRHSVIEALIETLAHYAMPDVASTIQADLRERLASDGYDSISSAQQLAELLNTQVQHFSQDPQLKIHFSPELLPHLDPYTPPTAEELAHQQRLSELRNFDFNRIERLAGNVGYLQLFGFEPPEFAGATAAAAMTFLASTQALIIDLRHNRGGSSGMVALLASYFLPAYPAVHLSTMEWSRASTDQSAGDQQWWSVPYLSGQRYLDKPLYLLIGPETMAAAEEFAYSLKQLKRVMLIGETTAGGANPGAGYRLDDHFWAFVPTGRVVNPITQGNWQGTGVMPDAKVPSELALPTAHLFALKDLLETVSEPSLKREIQAAIVPAEDKLNQMHQDLVSHLGGLR
jgi:retinol-binding protein 3